MYIVTAGISLASSLSTPSLASSSLTRKREASTLMAVTIDNGNGHELHFSSKWYLRSRENPYALHPV